jgi:hypothetical protein
MCLDFGCPTICKFGLGSFLSTLQLLLSYIFSRFVFQPCTTLRPHLICVLHTPTTRDVGRTCHALTCMDPTCMVSSPLSLSDDYSFLSLLSLSLSLYHLSLSISPRKFRFFELYQQNLGCYRLSWHDEL